MNIANRFLKYVSFDTQSCDTSETFPTTMKQKELGNYLVSELKQLNINNAHIDEYGIVYATLESNIDYKVDTIGLIAHMDTSPDLSGKDIKPRTIENYDGQDIVLNKEFNIVMKPSEFSSLNNQIGHNLIVTDGTTLLGADDKAGIAQIMTVVETLVNNPSIKHGTIQIAFTPDEEVGKGTVNFDIKKFNADYAYTVDGGAINDIEYENFNAASCVVEVKGINIHPGSAKNKMINASLIAMEFNALLPTTQRPMHTEGYEGFNHLMDITGEVEQCKMNYIIRNHDKQLFNNQKEDFKRVMRFINEKYNKELVNISIKDSYCNMKEYLLEKMFIVDQAKDVMLSLGLNPVSSAIRGGTDGANLSLKGLSTPNLGTGGYNFHGRYEYCSINEMELGVKLILGIINKVTNK